VRLNNLNDPVLNVLKYTYIQGYMFQLLGAIITTSRLYLTEKTQNTSA